MGARKKVAVIPNRGKRKTGAAGAESDVERPTKRSRAAVQRTSPAPTTSRPVHVDGKVVHVVAAAPTATNPSADSVKLSDFQRSFDSGPTLCLFDVHSQYDPSRRARPGRVFAATREIPAGKVTTYKSLAEAVGCGSSQAIGQAMRWNPFPMAAFTPPYPGHLLA